MNGIEELILNLFKKIEEYKKKEYKKKEMDFDFLNKFFKLQILPKKIEK